MYSELEINDPKRFAEIRQERQERLNKREDEEKAEEMLIPLSKISNH